MDRTLSWGRKLQLTTARVLSREKASSWILAGTLALAGLGASALTVAQGASDPTAVSASAVPATLPSGCVSDPDGDGHIFCMGGYHHGWGHRHWGHRHWGGGQDWGNQWGGGHWGPYAGQSTSMYISGTSSADGSSVQTP